MHRISESIFGPPDNDGQRSTKSSLGWDITHPFPRLRIQCLDRAPYHFLTRSGAPDMWAYGKTSIGHAVTTAATDTV